MLTGQRLLRWRQLRMTGRVHLSVRGEKNQKGLACAGSRIRSQDPLNRYKGLRPLCYPSGFEQNRKLNKITDKSKIDLTKLKLKIVFWSRGRHGVAWGRESTGFQLDRVHVEEAAGMRDCGGICDLLLGTEQRDYRDQRSTGAS
jgi:hypothetical protein